MSTAVILLAAGGSTRLGSPKQLLVYGGRTLLRRAAEAARAAVDGPVIVVLGAGAEAVRRELVGLAVEVVENPGWAQGMGGGVRRGMDALDQLERREGKTCIRGVLLTLCDQPLVDEEALRRIVAMARGKDEIVAAGYGGTIGVPVWFGRVYFEELIALPEDAGAKRLLQRHASRVECVNLPEAEIDVDTREQFERLVAEHEDVMLGGA